MLPTMNCTRALTHTHTHTHALPAATWSKQASSVSLNLLFQSLTIIDIFLQMCCQFFLSAALLLVIQIPGLILVSGASQSPSLD